MVGNKIDLEDERKISTKEASELAAQFQMKYFEASAKKNIGIEKFFETLMTQVYNKRNDIEARPTIKLNQPRLVAEV